MAKAKATKPKRKARPEVSRRSESPPPALEVPKPAPSIGMSDNVRWEERADKDAYALDLIERLVRYYGGRASATSNEAMRSAALVLNTLSLGLASDDAEQLAALAQAARGLRKGPPLAN